MSYLPEISMHDAEWGTVRSGKDKMGTVFWNPMWGCFVFKPRPHTHYGPAFLAGLVAEMIRMEAKRRKVME